MKKTIRMIFIVCILLLMNVPSALADHFPALEVPPPNEYVNFYGFSFTINGSNAQIGDEVGIYKGDKLCGKFIVHTAGQYGFVPVYKYSGVQAGDVLTFKVWDISENTEYTVTNDEFTAGSSTSGTAAIPPEWTADRDQWNLSIDITTPNDPPTAVISAPDSVCEEATDVTLNGSGSGDSDGTIEAYAWTQTGGADVTHVTLSDDTAASPTFTAPPVDANGATLTFELTVTDDDDDTDTTSVSIDIDPKPDINSFTADDYEVCSDATTTLRWSVSNADTSLILNPGNIDVKDTSSISGISPGTYTLTATNSCGAVTSGEVEITIGGSTAEITEFKADATSPICSNGTTTLSWTVTNAETLTLNPGNIDVKGTSSRDSIPPGDYSLTATGTCGDPVTWYVTVDEKNKPVISSFGASPKNINVSGDEVILSWSVSNADTLTISDIGPVTGDSIIVYPTTTPTTSYTLTAENECGSSSMQVNIGVGCPVPEIDFSASPSVLCAEEGSARLTWSVINATTVTINDVEKDSSGFMDVSPDSTTTYTLEAVGTCGTETDQLTVRVVDGKPTITSFSASPTAIENGELSTLSWSVTGASFIEIYPNNSPLGLGASGSRNVSPTETTTYTLRATNTCGETTRTVAVVVSALPVINTFQAEPASIASGESTVLSWDISGAASASISTVGTVNPVSGSQTVSPGSSTIYILTATNSTGSVTKQVTVGVDCLLPVIGSFDAEPSEINKGESATLSWTVTDATSVTIDNNIGDVDNGSGTLQVTPDNETTYTLTATNGCGAVTETVTVSVDCPKPVIDQFEASPEEIAWGESAILSWTVTGADIVTINNGIGEVDGTGTQSVTPETTTIYTLTATSECGQESKSINVNVTGNFPPQAPELMTPADGLTDVSLMPELTTGDFSDPDEDSVHTKTSWQISTDPLLFNDDSLVVGESSTENLTSWTIPSDLILEKGTTYYWRAMFFDGTDWSDPSEVFSFITGNDGPDFTDGVDTVDVIEDSEKILLPADFINNDGNPVNTNTIRSFKSKVDPAVQIGMIAQDCTIVKCGSIDPADFFKGDGTDPVLPFGLISFELSVLAAGDTATLTFYFSEPVPKDMGWWQYDPNIGFYDYEASTSAKVVNFSTDLKSVTVEYKDGSYGDLIEQADSKIIDPSGPVGELEEPKSGGGGGGGCFIDSLF